ncbi:ABC transporter ATP-binding protein [bacterium]|jgi:putative ABC transport system ATP-binding protein|nr:ABC transporter ATP-binding protein [bacterium]
MALIEVEELHKSYFSVAEEFKVLKDISLEVCEGDFVAIMGPSGSGKSTLMHLLGALDTATLGSYRFKGEEISTLSDAQLSHLRNREFGFVFQAFHLVPHHSVLENVLLPSVYSRQENEKTDKARSLLESLGISEKINFFPNQLSGGQCQRVAIARALLNDPGLILADEPTGNLDTKTGDEIMGLLQDLNTQGKTILMVTHEDEIAHHAKKILRLRDGKIERWETVEKPLRSHVGASI